MTPTPLPIHPWPLPEGRLDLLRSAKMMLQTDVTIIPVEATPGTDGRILSFGELPPFASESVLIRNVDSVESISKALSFLLEAPDGSPGLFTEEMWLSAVFGCGVRLIGVEPVSDVLIQTAR